MSDTQNEFEGWSPEDLRQYFLTGQGPDLSGKRPTAGVIPPDTMLAAPRTTASEIEPNPLKRAVAGAGMALENKWRGLTGQPKAEAYGLDQDPAGQFGAIIPDAVGSMAAPARVIPQALYGAATRAIEPAEDGYQRGRNALQGAAEFGGGQLLATGVVRGANALSGNLTREGQVAAAAKRQGLDMSAGDITDSRLLRTLEDKSIRSPSRNQVDQVAALMTAKQGEQMADPITNGVRNAYETAQGKVTAAATRLDDLVKQGNMPGVVPRNMYKSIQEISKHSPKTLDAIGDPQLRAVVDEIGSYPAGRIPKNISFSQLDELRKTLGPIMAKVESQATSPSSNVNVADANRWKRLYKGIMEDIDGWGSKSATADALAAHKELSSTFKSEVLPLREHPVSGKIIDGKYDRPEDLLRDLTSARNKSIINDLYGRLDRDGQDAFDALRLTGRGSREFVRGESHTLSLPEKMGLYGAGLTAPAWLPSALPVAPLIAGGLAGEQALVHGLNTRLGKAVLSGSPQAMQSPLGNAATYAGLRAALPQGILRTLRARDEQDGR